MIWKRERGGEDAGDEDGCDGSGGDDDNGASAGDGYNEDGILSPTVTSSSSSLTVSSFRLPRSTSLCVFSGAAGVKGR